MVLRLAKTSNFRITFRSPMRKNQWLGGDDTGNSNHNWRSSGFTVDYRRKPGILPWYPER